MKFRALQAQPVWRVGYQPNPWSWSGWRWAGPSGRFSGRWDALDAGLYRTLHAGDSLLACLVEVLAQFRPDPALQAELDEIVEETDDAPTATPGTLPVDEWLESRQASEAKLTGTFCDVTHAETIAALYPHFKPRASTYGLHDFDASALKTAEPRMLTQEISQRLWEARDDDGGDLCDGVQFRSRHGDNFMLWAVYERPEDPQVTPHISDTQPVELTRNSPELTTAANLLGVTLL